MKKISIIVPIYNAEKTLRKCINSIINQTYNNLEIILVNDGSNDKSKEICEEFELLDKRIIVINKKNGGQSSARNLGLEKSTGDFIAFVDSDDWIDKDIYKHCIKIIESNDCDIVDFNVTFVYEDEKTTKHSNQSPFIRSIEGKEILRDYLYRGQTERAPFSPCRKIYRRFLFESIRFPEGKVNEDIATNYHVLMKCNKLVITDKVGYFYFQSDNSTTRNGLRTRDFDLLDACEELKLLTKNETYKDIRYLSQVKYARSYFSLLAKAAFYGIEDEQLANKNVINELTKNLRTNYLLLISSPIPLSRKVMVTTLCINFRCLSIPLKIYKMVRK